MPSQTFSRLSRRPVRTLAAVVTATALTLVGCSGEEVDSSVETPVGLPVDPPRVTVQSTGSGPGQVLSYRDVQEERDPDSPQQSVSVEVSDGFNQTLVQADAVDVQAPAGGDVNTMTLPLSGGTTAAEEADPESEVEREASRDVELRLGQPSYTDLELTDDIRSAEGFLLGWRGGDDGSVSTVRLAAPKEATDEGRAMAEESIMTLLSMPVIFPEEAVGPGATWSVDSRVTGDATLLQTTTFTLVSVEGDLVELNVDVQQRPALGALNFEGRPGAEEMAGETLNVLNSNTTSEGSLTVDLTKPLPVDGRVAYTTRVVYGGENSDVRVVQDSTNAITYR
ncbi:hypothetical protein [Corynebacterium halotolerans]|uniref:Uncharacterized protein n=1 Tax=Corynebacterium halotolerans YIM 70093 = DSM 44683 TaxID=1121362 RepID=M1P878_9CORY|nr:hypothetical protein [Corynebacterium halotolerans]AGF72876.1 hypothetical protein A605_09370 [Corynebacterium halotolerans YIM 70093 = DSM 44683]